MHRKIAALALTLVTLAYAPAARAEDEQKPRAMPAYDGREAESHAGENAALFLPRVVFFPLWLVSEFVLRRPLEWLVVNAEKNQWPALILDFFTFGPDRTAGVFPTALFDFRLRPSVGLYTFWDKFLFEQNGVRFYAAYGGDDWLALRFLDRVKLDDAKKNDLSLTLGLTHRPDFPFHGVGADVSTDRLARYHSNRLEAILAFESLIGDAGSFRIFGETHHVDFEPGSALGDPSLDDIVAAGLVPAPPGYQHPYSLYGGGVEMAYDTRTARPSPGSGFRLELSTSALAPIDRTLSSPLISYGGAIGGFLDLTRENRVVSLMVSARFIDPLDHDGLVPFTELLSIGGTGPLTGFRDRALIGQSALAARFEYRWPVWVFLDGTLHFAVGNVFGSHAEDFDPSKLRMSFGLGMRTIGRPDQAFTLIAALGTETFEQGAAITSVRIAVGATRGF